MSRYRIGPADIEQPNWVHCRYTNAMMDLDEYRSAARQIAEYAKRSSKRRGKGYRSSGWKYYIGDFRGAKYGNALVETDYLYYDTQILVKSQKVLEGFHYCEKPGK